MIRQKANIQETSLLLSTVSRGTASVCDWFISSPTNQPVWRLTHWLIDWLIAVTLTHSSVIPMCQGWGQLVMSWVGVCSSHKFLPMLSHYLLEGHSVRNKPVSKGSCVVWAGEQYRHDNRLTYIHRCQRGDGAGWQWLLAVMKCERLRNLFDVFIDAVDHRFVCGTSWKLCTGLYCCDK